MTIDDNDSSGNDDRVTFSQKQIKREDLYALVWSEPMLKVCGSLRGFFELYGQDLHLEETFRWQAQKRMLALQPSAKAFFELTSVV